MLSKHIVHALINYFNIYINGDVVHVLCYAIINLTYKNCVFLRKVVEIDTTSSQGAGLQIGSYFINYVGIGPMAKTKADRAVFPSINNRTIDL